MTDAMKDREPHGGWLDPTEVAVWMQMAHVLVRLPAVLEADLQKHSGVALFEYLVLAGLSDAPDRTLRMSELAGCVNGSLSRLSHVVKRLETRGWVQRSPSPQDGRFTDARLTDAGLDFLRGAAPGHVDTVRRLLIDPLGAGRLTQLGEIAQLIIDQLPDDDCRGPS